MATDPNVVRSNLVKDLGFFLDEAERLLKKDCGIDQRLLVETKVQCATSMLETYYSAIVAAEKS